MPASASSLFTWKAPSAVGTQALTVTQTSAGTVAPDTFSNVNVLSAAATTTDLCCVSTAITSGETDQVFVTMRNDNNDIDTNYTGTVTFSATCGDCFTITPNNGGAATKSYTYTVGNAGERSFNLVWLPNAAGTQILTATATIAAGGTDADSQSGIDVTSTAATVTDLCCTSDPIEVGDTDQIFVTMRNQNNDIDTNYTGTVTFSATCGDCFTITPNNGAGAAAKQYTYVVGDAGERAFDLTWTATGTHNLTATGAGLTPETITSIDVTPATATDIDLTGVSDPIPVNTPDTINVRAVSAQGGTDQAYTKTVTFTGIYLRRLLRGTRPTTAALRRGRTRSSWATPVVVDSAPWTQTGVQILTVTDNSTPTPFSDSQSSIDVTGTTSTTGGTTSTTVGGTTSTTVGGTTSTTAGGTTSSTMAGTTSSTPRRRRRRCRSSTIAGTTSSTIAGYHQRYCRRYDQQRGSDGHVHHRSRERPQRQRRARPRRPRTARRRRSQ